MFAVERAPEFARRRRFARCPGRPITDLPRNCGHVFLSLQPAWLSSKSSAILAGERLNGPRLFCRRLSLDAADGVAAGLLVRLEFQQAALLRFEQQIVEGMKPVSALVAAGTPPPDRLLDHRTPNVFAFVPFSGQCLQRLGDYVERLVEGRTLVIRLVALGKRSCRAAALPGLGHLDRKSVV